VAEKCEISLPTPTTPPLKADLATTTTQNEKSKPRFVVYDPAVVLVKVFEIF